MWNAKKKKCPCGLRSRNYVFRKLFSAWNGLFLSCRKIEEHHSDAQAAWKRMRTLRAGESRNRICRCRSGKRAYSELQCEKTHSMNIKTFRWLPAENLSQRAAYRAIGVQLCCALLRCVLTVVLGMKTSTCLLSTQKRIANYHTRYMWHAILSTSSSDVVHTCRAISFWTAIERRNEHGTCIGAKRPL